MTVCLSEDAQYEPILNVEDLASTVMTLVQNLEPDDAYAAICGIIRRHDQAMREAVILRVDEARS